MQATPFALMMSTLWLAGCSLVFSPSEHQQGLLQEGLPSTVRDGGSADATVSPNPGQDAGDKLPDAAREAEADASGDGDGDGDGDSHDGGVAVEPDAAGDGKPDAGDGDGDAGAMCSGSPGQWAGCGSSGCAVCTEQLAEFPLYLQNHPGCVASANCAGSFLTCNDSCPAPSDDDREGGMCNGTPGGWVGCRGSGCAPCAEQLQGYTRYTQNHPRCTINNTCAGQFFTCNADCPAPTAADL